MPADTWMPMVDPPSSIEVPEQFDRFPGTNLAHETIYLTVRSADRLPISRTYRSQARVRRLSKLRAVFDVRVIERYATSVASRRAKADLGPDKKINVGRLKRNGLSITKRFVIAIQ